MKICLLGTGTSQGVPVIGCECKVCQSDDPRDKRLRSSAWISHKDTSIVIDCGADFRQQMLKQNILDLDAILLTHEHNDHIIGLDDVRPYNFMQRKDIPVYGQPRVLQEVTNRFRYIFEKDPYPGAPKIEMIPVEPKKPLTIKDMDILPLKIYHGSQEILGYKIGPIAYFTDVKFMPEETLQAVKGIKVLILNMLRKREHHSHLNVEEAVSLSREIRAERTFFIHCSHHLGLHENISDYLPENTFVGYDGLCIEID